MSRSGDLAAIGVQLAFVLHGFDGPGEVHDWEDEEAAGEKDISKFCVIEGQ